MMQSINPDTLSFPRGYSNGMMSVCGRILFVAGQVGWDKNEKMATGLTDQFEQAICNVLEVVKAAGGGPQNVGRLTIYIKDKQDYIDRRKEIGLIYRKHMGKYFPAMSLLVVRDLLEESALLEIEATAVLP